MPTDLIPEELPTERPTRSQVLRDRAADAITDAAARIPVVGAIVLAARHEHDSGGGLLAGGVAYRLFFWMLPMAFAASTFAQLAGISPEQDLEQAARTRGIGSLVVTAQRQAMDAAGTTVSWTQLAVTVALAVWFGHGVVRALNVQFALAWQQPIRRVRRPVVAGVAFTVCMTVLLGIASTLDAAVRELGLGVVVELLARIVIFAGVAFAIAVAFPHGDAPRRALWPGSVVGAIGAVGFYVGVDVYLAPKVDSSVSTYGMRGLATVILLWLYLFARLIGICAFLNAALYRSLHTDACDTVTVSR